MNKDIKECIERLARNAACSWCRCYKCDGTARNIVSADLPPVVFKCNIDELKTCHEWYDGYRTALMALNTLCEPECKADVESVEKIKTILKDKVFNEAWKRYPNTHTDTDYGECDYNQGDRDSFCEGAEFLLNVIKE